MNPVDQILSLVAPYECINCDQEGSVLCFECAETIFSLPSICYACGRASKNNKPCAKCINKWHPQHVWIYTEYSGLAKDLVGAYKFDGKRWAVK